jgi:hypothetical protein
MECKGQNDQSRVVDVAADGRHITTHNGTLLALTRAATGHDKRIEDLKKRGCQLGGPRGNSERTRRVRVGGKSNCTLRFPSLELIIKVERDVLEIEVLIQPVPAVRIGVNHLLEVGHDIAQHVRVRNYSEEYHSSARLGLPRRMTNRDGGRRGG